MSNKNKLPDNIDEYFAKIDGSKEAHNSRALLTANKEDVDLKTDLTIEEIKYINVLKYNDELLKSKGLKPVYSDFIQGYMRLKYSYDRKSRQEFVNVNKTNNTEDVINTASGIAQVMGAKK